MHWMRYWPFSTRLLKMPLFLLVRVDIGALGDLEQQVPAAGEKIQLLRACLGKHRLHGQLAEGSQAFRRGHRRALMVRELQADEVLRQID